MTVYIDSAAHARLSTTGDHLFRSVFISFSTEESLRYDHVEEDLLCNDKLENAMGQRLHMAFNSGSHHRYSFTKKSSNYLTQLQPEKVVGGTSVRQGNKNNMKDVNYEQGSRGLLSR